MSVKPLPPSKIFNLPLNVRKYQGKYEQYPYPYVRRTFESNESVAAIAYGYSWIVSGLDEWN